MVSKLLFRGTILLCGEGYGLMPSKMPPGILLRLKQECSRSSPQITSPMGLIILRRVELSDRSNEIPRLLILNLLSEEVKSYPRLIVELKKIFIGMTK